LSCRLVIFGSGSRGNSLLVANTRARILIDMGFSQRRLAADLAAQKVDPADISALFVTHTHSDHVTDSSLKFCHYHQVPLVSAAENLAVLRRRFRTIFTRLDRAGLIRPLSPRGLHIDGLDVRPFELPHDAEGLTLGFHVTLSPAPGAAPLRIAAATDLGHVTPEVCRIFCASDVLVLESNHDPQLLAASGRPASLISRITGDRGHLSNLQTAATVAQVLADRPPGSLRHLVLAHLSQECNAPALALAALSRVLAPLGSAAPSLSVAAQDEHLAVALN
jgi:phosphoribosyl 1,2-cyclic phosphodiesterase